MGQIRCLLLALFVVVGLVWSDTDGEACLDKFTKGLPNFVLDIDESVKTGAGFLGSPSLYNGRDCIDACCRTLGCNLALVQKADHGDDLINSCFLINCVSEQEFVCKFIRKAGFVNYVTMDVYDKYLAKREQEGEENPPIARAGPDIKTQPFQTVILTGIESWDKEGIESYKWSLLDGDNSVILQTPSPDLPDSVQISNLHIGDYVFQLIVTNSVQLQSSATVTITVLSREQTEEHCLVPYKTGRCRGSFTRWYYNQQEGDCLEFTYGGCKPNKNNYLRKEDCRQACMNNTAEKPPIQDHSKNSGRKMHPVCDGNCLPSRFQCAQGCCIDANLECDEHADCPDNSDELHCDNYDKGFKKLQTFEIPNNKARCVELPDTGPCRAHFIRWYYDPEARRCMSFTYGGCAGNYNNFIKQSECMNYCEGITASGHVAAAVFLGICILIVLALIGYFVIKKKRSNRARQNNVNRSAISTTEDTEHLVYNPTTKPV
ncbi:hypothetical protein GDO86_016323 [Hymenochirus boettgeri]|uniref:Kunitz-type protease inhibitor 1 n=1 Tax=Hymenochirus boettgeri TaxID=247094 RepID=A0A8T2JZY8_9PIPI|nr:hypothetical protein GDO86_016323 [Hymenochirus boettgeri]